MKLNITVMVTKNARNKIFHSDSGNVFLRTDGKALTIYALEEDSESFQEGEFVILNVSVI